MNSFRSVERAIEYEIDRQAAALDAGESLAQETRGWSDDRGATYHMRSKETSDDYRYFPEPDLPPLHVDRAWLDDAARTAAGAAGGTPGAIRGDRSGWVPTTRPCSSADPDASGLFEATLAADPALPAKSVANWVTGEYLRLRKGASGTRPCRSPRSSSRRSSGRVDDGTLSRREREGGLRGPREHRRRRGRDHRRAWPAPDLGRRRPRHGRRRRPGRQPGRGRRLSRRQGPGRGLPRRPGHEGDARPGERRAGPGRGARAPRTSGVGERMGPINLLLWASRRRARGDRLQPGPRSVGALPGAQGRGGQPRALRGVAWRAARPRADGRIGARCRCLRRQAQVAAAIAVAGVVLIFLGFVLR